MLRAMLISLAMLFAPLCSFSFTFDPVLPGQGEPTPTQEIALPTLTPSGWIGHVTPASQVINVRGCPATTCKIVQTLKVGETLPVLLVGTDWYEVEIPNIGTAWVAKQVVRYTPAN